MGALNQRVTDRYAIYNADCMDVLAALPDESVHGSIYSPPFAGLYHYSSDDRDFSNARDYDEFREMYGYLVAEKLRVTMPGRTTGVHAAVVPTGNTGKDALTDFPGDVIRIHQAAGWQFVARHVIWKEPLAVRNRTMAKNLAHKTIVTDSSYGGVAAPDELLIFRKPGDSVVPLEHLHGFENGYAGAEPIPSDLLKYRGWDGDQKSNRYSHWIWRRYASSVWDDVRIDRVLPFRDARDEDDEKHVHPLQLDVIERYLDMRTLPGERVLTPFMGVGSEVYSTVRMGRYGIGAELKPSYFTQAIRNLAAVDEDIDMQENDLGLFDLGTSDPAGDYEGGAA
ncbi:DNA-methyltransferase [Xylanimonas protaetiae]|nr:DNA methyltransferase [Xylanimonas protaetiae]